MQTKKTKLLLSIGSFAVLSTAVAQSVTIESVLGVAKSMGAFDIEAHPNLEKKEKDEADSILKSAATMFHIQMATEKQSRDAHAKGHGCAVAEFEISNKVPTEYQVGVLSQPGRTFDAIVRFSNGSGTTKADGIPDGRGLAIKVLDGAANGNLLGTGTTQDFLLINGSRFFIRSAKDYALFNQIVAQDKKPDRFFLERAIREALSEAGRSDSEDLSSETVIAPMMPGVLQLAKDPSILQKTIATLFPQASATEQQLIFGSLAKKAMAMTKAQAPLELKIAAALARPIGSAVTESYHSMASYLLKSGISAKRDTAVKYSARPVDCQTRAQLQPEAPIDNLPENGLRLDLGAKLASGERCFDFFIQPLPENLDQLAKVKLVEDPRLDYGTPEILVASLKLPVQNFDTPEKQKACEDLSFNPWQADPAHRPLGALNRARKAAVTASSIRRHFVTGAERVEPTTLEILKNK